MNKTHRGFAIHKFRDVNGVECSLQKSSVATDDFIWLGCKEIGLQIEIPGIGFRNIELKSEGPGGYNYLANTRMHLSREQVAELLPILHKFVLTGEID